MSRANKNQTAINPGGEDVKLTSLDIEVAVAKHFNYRANLIVPNVSWGWGLRHEADLLVLRPSGTCDEVEIKITASDIRADAKKRHPHWEDRRISRVWFAVPFELADCPLIPEAAGILAVARTVRSRDADGRWVARPWREGDAVWRDEVTVVRQARLRPKAERKPVTDKQRMKLATLGAMRIWALKETAANHCREVPR